MEQRTALVTGAMGGLGTALCRRLHADGFAIVATHSPGNAAREGWLTARRDEGMAVRAYELDVSNGNACEAIVRRILDEVA